MSPTRVTIVTMDYPSLNLTAEALLATSVAYVVVSVALALLLLYGVVHAGPPPVAREEPQREQRLGARVTTSKRSTPRPQWRPETHA